MARSPEGKVKTEIRKWLDARGIWYFMPAANGFGRSGIPDFMCCWNGHTLAIEAKAPERRTNTTTMQDRELENIRRSGGTALVVWDVAQLDEMEAARG